MAIFFALSGFLLHHGLAADARDGRTDLRAYAVRRAARVLPAYWLTLAAVVLATQLPVRTVAAQALTIQTYVPDTHLAAFSQSSSIPTEVSFYVVLPLVVVLLERARRRHRDLPVAILAGTALAAMLLLALVPVGEVGVDVFVERWLPARWPNFAVGMLLAEVVLRPRGRFASRVVALSRDTTGCLVVAGAAYLLATTPIAGPLTLGPASGLQLSARLALSTAVAGLLLAPLVLGRDDPYAAALGSGPARAVGEVSYGLFLWHLPVFTDLSPSPARSSSPVAWSRCWPLGLPISLLVGVAEPRRRRATRHALGGTTGPAPASTPAAMTARLTPPPTHGPGRPRRVGEAASAPAPPTRPTTRTRRPVPTLRRTRSATSATAAASTAHGPATTSAPPRVTATTTAGAGVHPGHRPPAHGRRRGRARAARPAPACEHQPEPRGPTGRARPERTRPRGARGPAGRTKPCRNPSTTRGEGTPSSSPPTRRCGSSRGPAGAVGRADGAAEVVGEDVVSGTAVSEPEPAPAPAAAAATARAEVGVATDDDVVLRPRAEHDGGARRPAQVAIAPERGARPSRRVAVVAPSTSSAGPSPQGRETRCAGRGRW